MRVYSAAALVILASLVSACGTKEGEMIGPEADQQSSWQSPDLKQALAEMKTAKAECGMKDALECSPSVGMLVTLAKDVELPNGTRGAAVGMCTGFLIGDHLLATNSHCIPPDLKKENSNCDGRIKVSFPSLPGFAEKEVGCAKVLVTSTIPESEQIQGKEFKSDYAYIELKESVKRPAIAINHEGVEEMEKITVDKMDPFRNKKDGKIYGFLRHNHCDVTYRSRRLPGQHFSKANILSTNCPIVPGNSGSPMRGADNSAKGIFFAISVKPKEMFLNAENDVKAAYVTSYACLATPADAKDFHFAADCDPERGKELNDETDVQMAQELEKKIQNKLYTLGDSRKFKMKSDFRWTIGEMDPELQKQLLISLVVGSKGYFSVFPTCFSKPAQTLSRYRSMMFFHEEKAEEIVQLPAITVRGTMDSMYRLELDMSVAPDLTVILDFSPKTLASTGKSRVTLRASTLSIYTSIPVFSDELGVCQAK